MSAAAVGEEPRQEIIIVRRSYDQDEGHHGGVWKIAFADFMTAMMCFFLVMWLINAANEQTKAAVASYFNPVKLIDRNSSKKGLEDLGDGPSSAGIAAENPVSPDAKAGEDGSGDANEKSRQDVSEENRSETHSDEHLFANPYAVLSEIAEETGLLQNISTRGDGGIQTSGPSTGAHGGEAYRDPFAPDFWSQQVSGGETAEGVKPTDAGLPASVDKPSPSNAQASTDAAPQEPLATVEPRIAETPKAEPVEGEPSAAAVKAADAIRGELAEALGPASKLAEGLTVVAGEDGVTISVTDQFDFGMFEVGSAVPRRDLVLAMEKIGKILAGQKGTLTIEGHTDARPFRNETYDNWRLSTARAHSAYYMLVRGGLDENRITTVAGHAARRLRNTADPLAASNRRIEILLDVGG
ncbi:MotB family protein [Mesorhizobium sp. KR9-304]|uniref:MotB family protein n=1 Tax=Mesorhizobium sp. KR9-304 TaxID=3156614 RepID=UPI0032B4BC13